MMDEICVGNASGCVSDKFDNIELPLSISKDVFLFYDDNKCIVFL